MSPCLKVGQGHARVVVWCIVHLAILWSRHFKFEIISTVSSEEACPAPGRQSILQVDILFGTPRADNGNGHLDFPTNCVRRCAGVRAWGNAVDHGGYPPEERPAGFKGGQRLNQASVLPVLGEAEPEGGGRWGGARGEGL